MDIRQIVEETLVAPMRAMASRPLTVAQDRAAMDELMAYVRSELSHGHDLALTHDEGMRLLRRLDHLSAMADGYRRVSGEHETMVSDLRKLLDDDDLDAARDIVKAEYDAIHGPRE